MEQRRAARRDLSEHRVGAVLRGRYQIAGVIGVGGMATVYLATHRNGHRVALKMLRPELSGHAGHRERFVREAYVANSLDHPGAVRVIDDDVAEDGSPFLVMELLVGETLEARYRRLGRLPPREVLAVGHALCDVLARAHACGVVHRDIKPDNIFLTSRGELKVLDFGIARVQQDGRESTTRTGSLMGTPAYMPPEQALGRRHAISGRSDLWAAGATMFALIAGRAVHQADAPEEMVVRSATTPAPALAEVVPEVAPAIAAVVDRALAFAPEDRFADAATMQAAIAAAHREAFAADIADTPLPRGQVAAPPATNLDVATFAAETLASDPRHAHTAVGPGTNTSLPGSTEIGADTGASLPPLTRLRVDTGASLPGVPGPGAHAGASLSGATRIDADPAATPSAARIAAGPAGGQSERTPSVSPKTAPRAWARRLGVLGVVTAVGVAAAIAAEAASAGCTTNAACATGDGPAICRVDQGRCVALTTDRCTVLAEADALADDATLWIGAMYPIRDESMAYGVEASRFVELARRDFTGLTGGLPPTRPGGRPRPIGVVMCDDTTDHEAIAAHLVDTVGVPAILGFGRSKEVLELANAYFVPKGVLALASNTAAMLSSIPHPPGEPRLVYRLTTSATMTAPPSAAFVRHVVEPALRGAGAAVGPDGVLRIAVVRSTNASGTSHTDALFSALAETRPAGAREEVRQFVVADEAMTDAAQLHRTAAEVAAYAPHLVLDGGATTRILVHFEAAWATAPRPRYVYGGVDPEVLRAATRDHADFPARLRVVATRDNTATAKAAASYTAAFGEDGADVTPGPYDAFYVLAYAAMAVGDEPVTGRSLARAIRRLVPPGEAIDVGPAGIYPALKVLGGGGSIDLQGTVTNLDFDPETGDPTADFAVFCYDAAADNLVESGAWYDASTRAIVGSVRCPDAAR